MNYHNSTLLAVEHRKFDLTWLEGYPEASYRKNSLWKARLGGVRRAQVAFTRSAIHMIHVSFLGHMRLMKFLRNQVSTDEYGHGASCANAAS